MSTDWNVIHIPREQEYSDIGALYKHRFTLEKCEIDVIDLDNENTSNDIAPAEILWDLQVNHLCGSYFVVLYI